MIAQLVDLANHAVVEQVDRLADGSAVEADLYNSVIAGFGQDDLDVVPPAAAKKPTRRTWRACRKCRSNPRRGCRGFRPPIRTFPRRLRRPIVR